jgi:4'-phosphopantetheinyl transferase
MPMLPANTVHVWIGSLKRDYGPFVHMLSPDEQQRAARFVFEHLRWDYTVAHGLLRQTLSTYLDVKPEAVRFKVGQYGKPRVDSTALRFNLSHSGELVVIGVCRDREIGIDVERVRALDDLDLIAKYHFSPREIASLNVLPAEQKQAGFFNCWTRKEAYIKALGLGLAQPLDQFAVSLQPGKPAELLYVEGKPEEPGRWTFTSFTPEPGYAGALAVEGKDCTVSFFTVPVNA